MIWVAGGLGGCFSAMQSKCWRVLSVLLLAFLALACGSALRSPADSGRPWNQYTSEHFELRTDVSESVAHEVIGQLEDSHWMLERIVFPYEPRLRRRTDVVLFDDQDALDELGHEEFAGMFIRRWSAVSDLRPIILAGGKWTPESQSTLQHELVHRFVAHHVPELPVWLNEGLAEYYSSAVIEADKVEIGHHLLSRVQAQTRLRFFHFSVDRSEVLYVPELMHLSPAEFYADTSSSGLRRRRQNYVSSWTAVYALQEDEGRKAFRGYLDDLHAAEISEGAAWSKHLGSVNLDKVYARQRDLIDNRDIELLRIEVASRPKPRVRVRTMAPAEVHALWSFLRKHDDGESTAAGLADAERAIALDPQHPDGYFMRGLWHLTTGAEKDVAADFWRAYEVSGGEPRYGTPLVRFATNHAFLRKDKRFQPLLRGMLRKASTAPELDALANYLLEDNRPSTATRFAVKAIAADSSCAGCYDTWAAATAALKDYAKAAEIQLRAVHLSGHEPNERYAKRLREYQERAGKQLEGYRSRGNRPPSGRSRGDSRTSGIR